MNSESFSKKTTTILLNFEIVLIVANNYFMTWLIKKLKDITSSQFFLVNPCRILAERVNAKTFSITGKCIFKCQITKGIIS